MSLVLVGASHHDASLEELDRIARAGTDFARELVDGDAVRGAVVLSTCNRFEVYLDLDRFHAPVEAVTALIAERAELAPGDVADRVRVTVGPAVVQHLFAVTAGLESMVVGEDEITGQVREALTAAREAGTTSPLLQRLLQRALSTSKTVTSTTELGAAGRSVVTVGLDLVESRHGTVVRRRALVLGTGAYARVVVAALRARGCRDLAVHSSSGRAAAFAQSHDLRAVDDLPAAVADADLVVAASGHGAPVLTADVVGARRDGRLPVLDLALASDLDDDVRKRSDVDVIDLEAIRAHAPGEHASAVLAAQEIVLAAAEDFERDETGRGAAPAVKAMRQHVAMLVDQEVERVRRRLGDQAGDEVARSLTRVTNALLHTPSVRAQELAHTGDLDDYAKAMHTLFGIEVPPHG